MVCKLRDHNSQTGTLYNAMYTSRVSPPPGKTDHSSELLYSVITKFSRTKAATAFSASSPSQFCLSVHHTGGSVKNGAK